MGGKGGGTPGVDPAIQQGELQNTTALVNLAKTQSAQGQQLFNLTEPGLASAESFYSSLASGDPGKIAQVTAPAAQQITQATQGAIKNIMENAPGGGEKNLAIEEAKLNQGAEIGKVATQGYLGSFSSLGQLAGQGIGESQSGTGLAISGLNSANQAYGQVGQQQLQGQEMQIEQKGQTLGAFGGLAGDATSIGTAFIGK